MSNLIQISNCRGVDCSIKKVQSKIYNHLMPIFGNVVWNCFPRVYKNKKQDYNGNYVFLPEFLDGTKEYTTDTLFDDTTDITSFFLVSDTREILDNQTTKVEVSLIISCFINKLYPNVLQKADEHLLSDIQNITYKMPGWKLDKIHTSVDEVYKEFSKKNVQFTDMSEKHLLRLVFTVNYQNC